MDAIETKGDLASNEIYNVFDMWLVLISSCSSFIWSNYIETQLFMDT